MRRDVYFQLLLQPHLRGKRGGEGPRGAYAAPCGSGGRARGSAQCAQREADPRGAASRAESRGTPPGSAPRTGSALHSEQKAA